MQLPLAYGNAGFVEVTQLYQNEFSIFSSIITNVELLACFVFQFESSHMSTSTVILRSHSLIKNHHGDCSFSSNACVKGAWSKHCQGTLKYDPWRCNTARKVPLSPHIKTSHATSLVTPSIKVLQKLCWFWGFWSLHRLHPP